MQQLTSNNSVSFSQKLLTEVFQLLLFQEALIKKKHITSFSDTNQMCLKRVSPNTTQFKTYRFFQQIHGRSRERISCRRRLRTFHEKVHVRREYRMSDTSPRPACQSCTAGTEWGSGFARSASDGSCTSQ